jgi:hypothetical protein
MPLYAILDAAVIEYLNHHAFETFEEGRHNQKLIKKD